MFLPASSSHVTSIGVSGHERGHKGHTLKLSKKKNADSSSRVNQRRELGAFRSDLRWGAAYIGEDDPGRPQANNIVDFENDLRVRFINHIRLLGHSYLRPPGAKKTMQALYEEAEMDDSDMGVEEDVGIDESEEDGVQHDEHTTEDEHMNSIVEQNEASDVFEDVEHGSDAELQDQSNEDMVDLDENIQEASDNEYDEFEDVYEDAYDEAQYQEGFMVEESYDQSVSVIDADQVGYSFRADSPAEEAANSSTAQLQRPHGTTAEAEVNIAADQSTPRLNTSARGDRSAEDLFNRSFLVDVEFSGEEDMSM